MDPNTPSDDLRPAPPRHTGRRRWPWLFGGAVCAAVVAFGVCEALGWPFMGAPVQRWLTQTLDRKVQLGADGAAGPQVRVRLLGSLRIHADYILSLIHI